MPDFTTLHRLLQRLDGQTIDRAVGERRCAGCAVGSAAATGGLVWPSTQLAWHRERSARSLCAACIITGKNPCPGGPSADGLKWMVVVDLDQQFLLSQIARRGPCNDCASLPSLVEAASEQTRIGLVLADAEFDSERNHTDICRQLGAQSVIPPKRGKRT